MVHELQSRPTLLQTLDIDIVSATADEVVLEMPIGPKVHQPMGLLHGGASAVMAETAASIGAYLNCDPDKQSAVGVDLNITHLRARRSGRLTARATPVKKGRTVHVWSIDIDDQDGERVAIARCTLAIRDIED
jgi:1,4-dihydroxy-2-naphthoyl-CoA hydrolase